ncbi:MAG: hypothetical protein JSW58_15580 [Candidatus Latescibacterota bacterium]|nr:MAG: hypothetical protein JSW58_15580 [Candidatus Latescibacterota bacterium]
MATTDTVIVDVDILSPPAPIDSCAFDVTYDPSVMTLISCEPGDLISEWQEFNYSDLGDRIHIDGNDPESIPLGLTGSFAILKFLSDCCGLEDPVQVSMCPVDLVGDVASLAPMCDEYRCEVFDPDGDVDANGVVTPRDALCAFKAYLAFPDAPDGDCGSLGWDVRSDVNCSGDITPADARCIFVHWLDGSCSFCSPVLADGPVAASVVPPVVSISGVEIDGDVMRCPIHVSEVVGMRAFGFEVTYPHGLEYKGIDRTNVTGSFVEVGAHVLAAGHLRVGGFSSDPVEGHDGGDVVVLGFRVEDADVGGTIIVQQFVDHLRGAEVVTYQLGSDRAPQSVTTSFRLYQNFPNPFNPVTTICYQIPEDLSDVPVKLTIYDVHGKRVRELVSGTQSGGPHQVEWDSRNDQGVPVSSGLYFYVLRAGSQIMGNKMVLLK